LKYYGDKSAVYSVKAHMKTRNTLLQWNEEIRHGVPKETRRNMRIYKGEHGGKDRPETNK
jgi:hypothetical protein